MTRPAGSDRPTRPLDDAATLIVQAFDAARQSGRENWSEMTIAVLKNRLLTLTGRTFDEADWGATSMREFVAMLPQVVSLSFDTHPPTARLVEGAAGSRAPLVVPAASVVVDDDEATALTPVDDPSLRIRDDLWRAVLDHSSGYTYYWDGERAVDLPSDDPSPGGLPTLPQVTRDEIDDWRRAFVERELANAGSEAAVQALRAWQRHELATHALPRPTRGRWNGMLKAHVADVLTRWFAAGRLPLPADLAQPKRAAEPDASDTEQLRRLVVSCVMGMTREELRSLSLPVAAVLRQRRDSR